MGWLHSEKKVDARGAMSSFSTATSLPSARMANEEVERLLFPRLFKVLRLHSLALPVSLASRTSWGGSSPALAVVSAV